MACQSAAAASRRAALLLLNVFRDTTSSSRLARRAHRQPLWSSHFGDGTLASALGCPPFPRPMPAIVVEQLVKTFQAGRVRALDGVTLALEPGEAVGIIGPNGA